MTSNLHITYRHMPSSEALSEAISLETVELESHCGHPLTCRITLEPLGHGAMANRCRVHIDASHGGDHWVVDRKPEQHVGHDDAYLAVREAFSLLRQQVDRTAGRRLARRHADAS